MSLRLLYEGKPAATITFLMWPGVSSVSPRILHFRDVPLKLRRLLDLMRAHVEALGTGNRLPCLALRFHFRGLRLDDLPIDVLHSARRD